MKPIDVGNNKRVYIDEHNEKRSRFKVGDRVRISKIKNIFPKEYLKLKIYFLKDILLTGVVKYLLLIK